VDLDHSLGKAFFNEERGDLEPLISLKLDNLAKFFVVDYGAVASKFLRERISGIVFRKRINDLLESLEKLLGVVLWKEWVG
jgi:hypothetical protein